MTKQTITIAVGVAALCALGAWFLMAPRAEAPVVTPNPAPVTNTQETASTTADTASSTPTSTPSIAPAVKSETKPTAVIPKPYYALVTYDGQNFTPHIVSIPKGGTVRFLNVSSEPMWVASGIHPFHSEYPIHTAKDCAGSIFDECAPVDRGGHWDFKFDVDGKWDYHNHKNPISGGFIRVLLPGQQ